MSTVNVEVLAAPAARCAEMLCAAARAGGNIVLTGGSTPRTAYEQAARHPEAWATATLWWGDERCVPPDDDRSNCLLAQRALLGRLNATGQPVAIHRIAGELGPQQAAAAYERELEQAGPPAFDLLLLGIGPDGHIASMFPDQASLEERSRLVVGVAQAGLKPYVPRVTLTFPALALARHVVVLASGTGKAQAVAGAFGPDADPTPHLPASLLSTLCANVTVLLDRDAASRL
ncbi:MAG: 6-phosphogluconolactonase [Solirubrobacteraceae bacterium]